MDGRGAGRMMDRPTSTFWHRDCEPLLTSCSPFFIALDRHTSQTRHSDGPAGIPSRREASPHRVRADSQDLPYAHLRGQRGRREVPLLVLPQVRPLSQLSFIPFSHRDARKLKKVKKANGEIIGVNVVSTISLYPTCAHCSPQEAGGKGSFADLACIPSLDWALVTILHPNRPSHIL